MTMFPPRGGAAGSGTQGPQGVTGPQGATGATGAQGPQGVGGSGSALPRTLARSPVLSRPGWGNSYLSTFSGHAPSGTNVINTRTKAYAPDGAANVVPRFVNWSAVANNFDSANREGDAQQTDPIQVTFAIERTDGALVRAFFTGQGKQATIQPGGEVEALPMAIDLLPGEACWLRTCVKIPTLAHGAPVWGPIAPWFTGDAVVNSIDGADLTYATGALAGGATFGYGYGPFSVDSVEPVAATVHPTALVGDSIFSDRQAWIQRALGYGSGSGLVPYMDVSRATEGLIHFLSYSADYSTWRRNAIRGCTAAVSDYGINDLFSGSLVSLGTLQARARALWALLRRRGVVKIIHTTLTPATVQVDSAAGWAPENQTIVGSPRAASEPTRLAWNAWLRSWTPVSGKPGLYWSAAEGVYAYDAAVRVTTTNSRSEQVWKFDTDGTSPLTIDGLHPSLPSGGGPSGGGHAVIAAGFNAASFLDYSPLGS